MSAIPPAEERPPWRHLSLAALGAVIGGVLGGGLVVVITLALKAGMERVASQPTWVIVIAPLVGLVLTMLVLYGVGREEEEDQPGAGRSNPWRTFPRGVVRADITSDIIDTANHEEDFPWWLAPLRALAIFATVGLGGPLGTESPAAYVGVATGAWAGDHGQRWRRVLRPAAVAGGSAGVAALMGLPLVGTTYILELGLRGSAPVNTERLLAGTVGGVIGWGIDAVFNLQLINLVIPHEPPDSAWHAIETALVIGAISGAMTSLTGTALYRAKKWHAAPWRRLLLSAAFLTIDALMVARIAGPAAAGGPGGGAIAWASEDTALPAALLAVCLLRGAATVAAVAGGGCGGIFLPMLAVGDLSGRVVAPGLGVGHDLSGAAGAAGGIAGGYRLPFTAVAMVLGVGGPPLATLTSLAAVGIAFFVGAAVDAGFDSLDRIARRTEAQAQRQT
jgi:H+/Cl- antiporter ClcA